MTAEPAFSTFRIQEKGALFFLYPQPPSMPMQLMKKRPDLLLKCGNEKFFRLIQSVTTMLLLCNDKEKIDKLDKKDIPSQIGISESWKKGYERDAETLRKQVREVKKQGLVVLIFLFFIIIFAGMYIGFSFMWSIVAAIGIIVFLWKKEGSSRSETEERLEIYLRNIDRIQETIQYLRSRYHSLDDV